MAIRLTRPSDERLRRLLRDAAGDSLTYQPVGITNSSESVPGFHRDRWSRALGEGDLVWQRARDAIAAWQVQRGSGILVCADGPPAVGADVAMAAPLLVGYIDVVCRVVAVVDEADRFGFTYGTLPNHPAQGEESFTIIRSPDDGVRFEIVAVSRPRLAIARLAAPIARRLQRSATDRYFAALTRAVTAPT